MTTPSGLRTSQLSNDIAPSIFLFTFVFTKPENCTTTNKNIRKTIQLYKIYYSFLLYAFKNSWYVTFKTESKSETDFQTMYEIKWAIKILQVLQNSSPPFLFFVYELTRRSFVRGPYISYIFIGSVCLLDL